MAQTSRRKFTRVSDWHDFLEELQREGNQQVNLYQLRQACYKDIEDIRRRPLLVYAVKFPLPPIPPQIPVKPPISIDLEDLDGFTDLVDSITGQEEVDVLLHSPGGSPEATERIVELLRTKFEKVCFLILHSAYSAATMLALSGDEIILHRIASLGPIDPQINGIPARALKRGFEKAKKALQEEGPEALPAYVPLIEKYTLELLEICEDYEQLSRELVTDWLSRYMFKGDASKQQLIDNAVNFFSNYDNHRTHSRALTYSKVKDLGLNISLADEALESLLREAHILLNGFFNLTPFVKVYENSSGLSWGKQFQAVVQQAPPQSAFPRQQKGTAYRLTAVSREE